MAENLILLSEENERERKREREDDLKERFELHRVTMFTDKTEARISLMGS